MDLKRFALFILLFVSLTSFCEELTAGAESMDEMDEVEKPLSFSAALTSDYMYRGQTQTEHEAALQGGADWKHHSGVHLGLWGSNVRTHESKQALEANFSGGFRFPLVLGIHGDLGASYFAYTNGGKNAFDFPVELTWKYFRVGGSYTPRYGGDEGHAYYVSAGFSKDIIWGFTTKLDAGYSILSPETGYENYADFRAGISREVLTIDWEIAGTFVDHRQFNGSDDPRIVLTASKSF